jgi:hypothetical protein
MSEETVTPTGFLKTMIRLEKAVQVDNLAFARSGIFISGGEMRRGEWVSMSVGEFQVIPLRPGLYAIVATLGALSSDPVNTEIKEGEVTTRIFHFGKKSK